MTNHSKFAAKPIDSILFQSTGGDFLLPANPGGHAAYQDTFVSGFLKFYPDPFVLPKSTRDYIVQFWYLDLSRTDSIMQDCYSVFGPEPRLPSCMLRSCLPALKLKVTSVMLWCRGIMMLQHLDAWEMPSAEAFQKSFLGLAA